MNRRDQIALNDALKFSRLVIDVVKRACILRREACGGQHGFFRQGAEREFPRADNVTLFRLTMANSSPKPSTLDFNYIKSADFREAACDGVIGGPTPAGKLWVAFFTERFPLPRRVRHAIRPTDKEDEFELDPGSESTPVESLDGVIRNVEFGLYLTRDAAVQLHEWLGRNLENLGSRNDG